jgi:GntR family transcriptional regulator
MHLTPGPIPKYYQLTEILRQRITSGELKPGDQLPTEETLCSEFDLSRGTVRHAFSTLVNEGLVRREQGRGTFVILNRPRRASFELARFDKDMRQQHHKPGTRLLKLEVKPASKEIAARLNITTGDKIIHIVRLRLADKRPVIYETRYLAYALCPELVHDDLENESIHSLLIHKYHLPMIRTEHIIEIRPISAKQARLMEVSPDTMAFYVDRLTYTTTERGERPAVWYQAIYRGDEYQFRAEFEAQN